MRLYLRRSFYRTWLPDRNHKKFYVDTALKLRPENKHRVRSHIVVVVQVGFNNYVPLLISTDIKYWPLGPNRLSICFRHMIFWVTLPATGCDVQESTDREYNHLITRLAQWSNGPERVWHDTSDQQLRRSGSSTLFSSVHNPHILNSTYPSLSTCCRPHHFSITAYLRATWSGTSGLLPQS